MKWIFVLLSTFSLSALAKEPEWVMSPESLGYSVAIVGSAMPQKMGEKAQYRMAEMSVRREFSENKSTYIKSIQNAYTDSEGNSHFESNTYTNSSGLLNFSHLTKVKEWKDPDTQELFLLYVIRP